MKANGLSIIPSATAILLAGQSAAMADTPYVLAAELPCHLKRVDFIASVKSVPGVKQVERSDGVLEYFANSTDLENGDTVRFTIQPAQSADDIYVGGETVLTREFAPEIENNYPTYIDGCVLDGTGMMEIVHGYQIPETSVGFDDQPKVSGK